MVRTEPVTGPGVNLTGSHLLLLALDPVGEVVDGPVDGGERRHRQHRILDPHLDGRPAGRERDAGRADDG